MDIKDIVTHNGVSDYDLLTEGMWGIRPRISKLKGDRDIINKEIEDLELRLECIDRVRRRLRAKM